MSEGLSAAEVGNEIEHHRSEARADVISVIEAILLAVVALVAGWSGFASAKWSTESRLALAQSATARSQASRAELRALDTRNFDASTFNAWFTAYVAGDEAGDDARPRSGSGPSSRSRSTRGRRRIPRRIPKLRPGPRTCPSTNNRTPHSRPSSTRRPTRNTPKANTTRPTADDYVRITVYLATVLFLVGISGHFKFRAARYGLVTIGVIVTLFAVAVLTTLPGPPG